MLSGLIRCDKILSLIHFGGKGMKQKKKRQIKYIILMIILFVLFYFILEKIYSEFIYEKVRTDENGGSLLVLKNILQSILSFFLANVVNILRLRFDTKKENNKDVPYLHMSILYASGIRRHLKRTNDPEIIIGAGTYFIYVNACIENVGEGILENCKVINTKLQGIRLSTGKSSNILFRIYIDDYRVVDEILSITFFFSDTKDRYFKREYKINLKANEKDETSVEIVSSKKQRRIRKWQK